MPQSYKSGEAGVQFDKYLQEETYISNLHASLRNPVSPKLQRDQMSRERPISLNQSRTEQSPMPTAETLPNRQQLHNVLISI